MSVVNSMCRFIFRVLLNLGGLVVLVVGVALSPVSLASTTTVGSKAPVESLVESRHHNVVLQQWELSCAAAALATVLRYQHGVPVTERSVALGMIDRPEYIANPELVRLRQGFSLLDMKRLTDRMGYTGLGLGQMTFEDLLQRIPVIVPINSHGYPHFVVFRGATSKQVLLADPAFGNVTLAKKDFLDSWINYRAIGHVGFVVTHAGKRADKLSDPGQLRPRLYEFPLIR